MTKVNVTVQAADPLSQVGMTSYLGARPEIRVLNESPADADVIVLWADEVTPHKLAGWRRSVEQNKTPIIVVHNADKTEQPLVAEDGVSVLSASFAEDGRLADVVLAVAKGEPIVVSAQGGETEEVEGAQRSPSGTQTSGLTGREVEVLRLVAQGHDTDEIAKALNYSPRTVKNLIYNLTNRLSLRNRPHAVAYGFRAGLLK